MRDNNCYFASRPERTILRSYVTAYKTVGENFDRLKQGMYKIQTVIIECAYASLSFMNRPTSSNNERQTNASQLHTTNHNFVVSNWHTQ